MGNNPKVMFGAPLVAAILIYVITSSAVIAFLILLLGFAGVITLIKRQADAAAPQKTNKKGVKNKGRKVNEFPTDRGTTTTKPSGGGLPTWSPGGLDTWKPPSFDDDTDGDTDVDTKPAAKKGSHDEEPALEDTWGKWDNDWSVEEEAEETLDEWSSDESWLGDALATDKDKEDKSPLSGFGDLDAEFEEHFGSGDGAKESTETVDLDEFSSFEADFAEDTKTIELDEFEEAEEPVVEKPAKKGGGFSFSSAPPVVNEDVESADDIMAASHATELSVVKEPAAAGGPGENSELAKLLAKVQARLSAYE